MPTPTSTRPKFAIVIVKRYPRHSDNIRRRRERRADYLPRGRGRAKQVYNHYPYPYTRIYVRANTCSIFWPHTEHMFDTVKPVILCYFFAHPYRRFFQNTGPIGSRRITIPKPNYIKNSILFFIFELFCSIFLRL